MESRAKLFGHAIHPILIVYPLGLLSAGVIFDVIYLVTGNTTWTLVSFWMIAAGMSVVCWLLFLVSLTISEFLQAREPVASASFTA